MIRSTPKNLDTLLANVDVFSFRIWKTHVEFTKKRTNEVAQTPSSITTCYDSK